jgi:hypothetical protein
MAGHDSQGGSRATSQGSAAVPRIGDAARPAHEPGAPIIGPGLDIRTIAGLKRLDVCCGGWIPIFTQVEFGFEMSVKRIREAPRITKPFSDESRARLDRFGEQVDADLKAHDMRLTMGGEPTFVSIDDLESPEWNIAAVGRPSGHWPTI